MKIKRLIEFFTFFSLPLFWLFVLQANALEIESWETSNGSRVMFYHAPEIPMVDIRLVFAAGSVRDGERFGLSRMANKLLLEGSGGSNAKEFKDRLSETGARLYAGSLREMAFINLRTLAEKNYFNTAVELLVDAVSSPNYDESELDKVIEEMLFELSLRDESPNEIAQEAIWSKIYEDHPYSNYPGGTKSTVPTISSSHLREFHSKYYVANNMTIAIVGSLKKSEAKDVANRISSSLSRGERATKIPEFSNFKSSESYIETNSRQTHIRIGTLGISRSDEDYFPMIVGNHILGGSSLVSLLFDEIRTKRGLSYSVYSYFIPTEIKGPFILGLQTNGDKQYTALRESLRVLNNFVSNGPSKEQFELAKKNLISGFINRIDSNDKMIGYISMMGFYDLPLNYLQTFTAKVKSVSIVDVKDCFQRRFQQNFSIVLVGSEKNAFGNNER